MKCAVGPRAQALWDGCGGTAELTVELFPGLLLSGCLVCFKCCPKNNFRHFLFLGLLGFRFSSIVKHIDTKKNIQTHTHKCAHTYFVHVGILNTENLSDSYICSKITGSYFLLLFFNLFSSVTRLAFGVFWWNSVWYDISHIFTNIQHLSISSFTPGLVQVLH